jgi:hypothetical protein
VIVQETADSLTREITVSDFLENTSYSATIQLRLLAEDALQPRTPYSSATKNASKPGPLEVREVDTHVELMICLTFLVSGID